jgi:hypothetical protein
MNNRWIVSAKFLGLWLLLAPVAFAQQYPNYRPGYGPSRPQLSPYLELLRGGNRAANYYLGVVPEVERRRNAQEFGTAIQDLERRSETAAPTTGGDVLPPLAGTGHATYFLNYSSYFNLANYQGINTLAPQQQVPARGRR